MKKGRLITQYRAAFAISDEKTKNDYITWKFVHRPHVNIKNEMHNKDGQDEVFATSDEYFEVHILQGDKVIGSVKSVMCQYIEYSTIERETLD